MPHHNCILKTRAFNSVPRQARRKPLPPALVEVASALAVMLDSVAHDEAGSSSAVSRWVPMDREKGVLESCSDSCRVLSLVEAREL